MSDLIKSSLFFDVENVKQTDDLKPKTFWKYQGWRFLNTLITVFLIVVGGVLLILAGVFVWFPLYNVVK